MVSPTFKASTRSVFVVRHPPQISMFKGAAGYALAQREKPEVILMHLHHFDIIREHSAADDATKRHQS